MKIEEEMLESQYRAVESFLGEDGRLCSWELFVSSLHVVIYVHHETTITILCDLRHVSKTLHRGQTEFF